MRTSAQSQSSVTSCGPGACRLLWKRTAGTPVRSGVQFPPVVKVRLRDGNGLAGRKAKVCTSRNSFCPHSAYSQTRCPVSTRHSALGSRSAAPCSVVPTRRPPRLSRTAAARSGLSKRLTSAARTASAPARQNRCSPRASLPYTEQVASVPRPRPSQKQRGKNRDPARTAD